MSSSGLKRHQGLKHKNIKALPENFSKLTASEFFSLVKRCPSLCQQDLCSPEDIRNDDDALELWKYLEPIIEEFQGMLRNIT